MRTLGMKVHGDPCIKHIEETYVLEVGDLALVVEYHTHMKQWGISYSTGQAWTGYSSQREAIGAAVKHFLTLRS